MTAIVGLANGNLGQQLVLPLVESREILEVGPKILRPLITRLIEVGALPTPQGGDFKVDWPDLMNLTDKERADVALQQATAAGSVTGKLTNNISGNADTATLANSALAASETVTNRQR